jgi:hypothetical protein
MKMISDFYVDLFKSGFAVWRLVLIANINVKTAPAE